MPFAAQIEAPPIRQDATGALRVGDSRVLLELVIHAFQDGATPETIVQSYSTLSLRDVYGVIAYYLRHPHEINDYLQEREEAARLVRKKIEGLNQDLTAIRARLQARRES